MKRILALLFFTLVAVPYAFAAGSAKEYVYPQKSPAFSVPIPSSWTAEVDESGFTANPKDAEAVEVAYFVVEGKSALEQAATQMQEYIESSWSNIKKLDDKSIAEGGKEYHMYSMSGNLTAEKSQLDNIQVWVYSPAPNYAAFAVMSIDVNMKNTDKYIEQFVDMLTGTKALSSASSKSSGADENEGEE